MRQPEPWLYVRSICNVDELLKNYYCLAAGRMQALLLVVITVYMLENSEKIVSLTIVCTFYRETTYNSQSQVNNIEQW